MLIVPTEDRNDPTAGIARHPRFGTLIFIRQPKGHNVEQEVAIISYGKSMQTLGKYADKLPKAISAVAVMEDHILVKTEGFYHNKEAGRVQVDFEYEGAKHTLSMERVPAFVHDPESDDPLMQVAQPCEIYVKKAKGVVAKKHPFLFVGIKNIEDCHHFVVDRRKFLERRGEEKPIEAKKDNVSKEKKKSEKEFRKPSKPRSEHKKSDGYIANPMMSNALKGADINAEMFPSQEEGKPNRRRKPHKKKSGGKGHHDE